MPRTGNLRRELVDLALHAQRVGADASVRFAQVMSEFANRIGSYRAASRCPGSTPCVNTAPT